MWKDLVSLTDNGLQVIASLPSGVEVRKNLTRSGLTDGLGMVGAEHFFLFEQALDDFISLATSAHPDAQNPHVIAEKKDAQACLILSEQDLLASMRVIGAYGGKPLGGVQLIQLLQQENVTKGINKLALKKVLIMSHQLKPGEEFVQAVAQGKPPINGKDARFIPLVKDAKKQRLTPQERGGKVDMLDLGGTINVAENQPLMKRIPSTKGTDGITVQGKLIPAKPGKDAMLKESKGSVISAQDPNILIADRCGMPIISDRSVEVDDVLSLSSIGVATGHIKFKGNVVVRGNIESDMIVRATGNLIVDGFIESADVQVKGDIEVKKGIIGHNVSEGETRSCLVKAGGSIRANYAQFSELQAAQDIHLSVHCLNNEIRVGGDLVVCDSNDRQGTLSGGSAKIGGKVICVNLGVEGDTATSVELFAHYQKHKARQTKLKECYKQAQEGTMNAIRKELEFKKRPKGERNEQERDTIDRLKQNANKRLEQVKEAKEVHDTQLEMLLERNTLVVKSRVFTHVTVLFGSEKVITKRTHGASTFSFNGYAIKCQSLFDKEALEEEL
ncbi:DUF342 domain-containing protein [Vibrio sinensis]|uniref:DUF342 domain-containing protein n=1 Tax=Vibrio sinensis TaxID=2302434 RepID=A0A3A6QKI4_9VIBR|nr:FapA family protein [Vibrio sinensis]RJX66204.1 DUF342 domain-containing protein [Vibrio sinensis]